MFPESARRALCSGLHALKLPVRMAFTHTFIGVVLCHILIAFKMSCASRTTREHKTPESNKSAHRLLGRLHSASRSRRAQSGQAEHAADRVQTFDVTDPDQAVNPQDDLLFPINPDARHRHWVVCQSLCVWAAGVKP